MKRFWVLLCVCAFTVAIMPLAGCNTMEGAGKDVEKAGEAIQDAAE